MARYIINNLKEEIPWEENESDISRVVQNAKNLLMCHMGELPYDRYRGFDMNEYGQPLSDFQSRLPMEIERIMAWEPRVTVISCEAEMVQTDDERDMDVLITVIIETNINE